MRDFAYKMYKGFEESLLQASDQAVFPQVISGREEK